MGLPEDTEAVIIELTERCLQKHVCEKFESIVTNSFLQKQRFEKIYEATRPTAKPTASAANLHDNHACTHVGKNSTCTAHHDATYNPQVSLVKKEVPMLMMAVILLSEEMKPPRLFTFHK